MNDNKNNKSIILANSQKITKYSSENLKRALSLAEELEQSAKIISDSGNNLILQTKTWKCVHEITKHRDWIKSLAITPNGRILVSGSDDKTIRTWDIKTGKEIKAWIADSHKINSLIITPNGNHIISGGFDRDIKIWDIATGEIHSTLSGHNSSIYCLAMSNDGKTVISSSHDKTIKIWNWQTGYLLNSLEIGCCYSIAISKDQNLFIVGNQDDSVQVFDLRTKTEIHRFEGNSSRSVIGTNCVAIDPQQEYIFSGHEDGSIRLCNLKNKTLIHKQQTRGSIHALALSPNGKTLAIAGMGGSVKLWNLESMKVELSLLEGAIFDPTKVFALALSLDGLTLVTGDSKRIIKIWSQV